MKPKCDYDWSRLTVSPAKVMAKVEPGMTILLGTASTEPRTLVKELMSSTEYTLQDLEIVQVASLGDMVGVDALASRKFRLKTFFSGWVASEAIGDGQIDLIPTRFSRIARAVESGQLDIDAVFLQVSEPNEAGYVSMGAAVDLARQAMEKAQLKVGEICPEMPRTFGDSYIPVSEFDYLVAGQEPPYYFERWPRHPVWDAVAANAAALIDDGACISFSPGPLFEALAVHLTGRRNLGVHSPFFTDALMDLVNSGAVSNRRKEIFRGKSVASYALGTRELMTWLDHNPLVEFQPIEKVFNPQEIGRNNRFKALFPIRRVDLTGRAALHFGRGSVMAGPSEVLDFAAGAELSKGGRIIFGLPSRNRAGKTNIRVSIEDEPNQLGMRESVDMIVTEYGTAFLRGRTVRERAQAMIEIAHPEDRPALVEQAKAKNLIYRDQIFLAGSVHIYPDQAAFSTTLKDGTNLRVRAIKPSDEEQMRRLFYRFSDESVYYRFFSPVRTMPHPKMQEYVCVDYGSSMSLVGMVGEIGQGRLIAEARYVKHRDRPMADVAFIVDEEYQGRGIATILLKQLVSLARKDGLKGFTADVLSTNKPMLKVFEKSLPMTARLEDGAYSLTMLFDAEKARPKNLETVRPSCQLD